MADGGGCGDNDFTAGRPASREEKGQAEADGGIGSIVAAAAVPITASLIRSRKWGKTLFIDT